MYFPWGVECGGQKGKEPSGAETAGGRNGYNKIDQHIQS